MTEPAAGPSGPGTVVMELGAGIGALVLYTPADLDGTEIEISRDDDPGAGRTHSQVRRRHVATMTKYAAVYQSLPAGRYTIWRDEHTPAAAATITGGQVTSCRWPD
jgi:hypothetical protein